MTPNEFWRVFAETLADLPDCEAGSDRYWALIAAATREWQHLDTYPLVPECIDPQALARVTWRIATSSARRSHLHSPAPSPGRAR